MATITLASVRVTSSPLSSGRPSSSAPLQDHAARISVIRSTPYHPAHVASCSSSGHQILSTSCWKSLQPPLGGACRQKPARKFLLRTRASSAVPAATPAPEEGTPDSSNVRQLALLATDATKVVTSMGALLYIDAVFKQLFNQLQINFPHALGGMFVIFAILLAADAINPRASEAIVQSAAPARAFIRRWLTLFFVPSMVILPLSIAGLSAVDGVKLLSLIAILFPTSLIITAATTIAVRQMVSTEASPPRPSAKLAPYSLPEMWSGAALAAIGLILVAISPTLFGGSAIVTSIPLFLGATVLGFVFGQRLPPKLKAIFHPIITTTAVADVACYLYAKVAGVSFNQALNTYMTRSPFSPGTGDLLMSCLGPVILSFAFSIYEERDLIRRHAWEMFTAIPVAAIYGLVSSAMVGRVLGLSSELTRSCIPRCITVPLALPIGVMLGGASASLIAAVVFFTGLLGAMFGQRLLDILGYKDPVVRGLATACSSHGLGTAALAGDEPQAVPFAAIAMALTGIISSLFVAIPPVKVFLLRVAG